MIFFGLMLGDFFSYFPVDHLIRLEVTDDSYLGSIRDVAFYQGGIAVLDDFDHLPVLFDPTGRFLRVLGAKGRGPFEVINCAEIEPCWGGSHLAVVDRIALKIVVFDAKGKPVFETPVGFPVPTTALFWPRQNELVMADYFPDDQKYMVARFNPLIQNQPAQGLIDYPPEMTHWHGGVPVYKGIFQLDDRLWVSDLFHSSVLVLDRDYQQHHQISLPKDDFFQIEDLASHINDAQFPFEKNVIWGVWGLGKLAVVEFTHGAYVYDTTTFQALDRLTLPMGKAVFCDDQKVVHVLQTSDVPIDYWKRYPAEYALLQAMAISEEDNHCLRVSMGPKAP